MAFGHADFLVRRSCGLVSSARVAQRDGLVTAASAAAITTAAAASTAVAAATAAGLLGFGLIDGQRAAVMLGAAQRDDGCLGFLVRTHLDKAEAFAAAAVAIHDDLCRADCSVRRENLLQVRVRDGVGEVSDVQLAAHSDLLDRALDTEFDFQGRVKEAHNPGPGGGREKGQKVLHNNAGTLRAGFCPTAGNYMRRNRPGPAAPA